MAEADDRKDIEGWRAPFDGVSVTSPEVKLSRRIQAEIKRLIDRRHHDRPCRRPPPAALWRRAGAGAASRQSVRRGDPGARSTPTFPVAGADRLKLTEHIAIIDLMNLADALLLPQDDLALAVALKSPLFGLTDDDLFTLAWQRKGSLREALRRSRGERTADQEAALRRLEPMRTPLRAGDAVRLLRLAARRRRRPAANPADGSGTRPMTRSTSFSSWR